MSIYGVSYSEVYNRYTTVEASNAEEAEEKFSERVESDADDFWVDGVYLEEEEEDDEDEYDEEPDDEDDAESEDNK